MLLTISKYKMAVREISLNFELFQYNLSGNQMLHFRGYDLCFIFTSSDVWISAQRLAILTGSCGFLQSFQVNARYYLNKTPLLIPSTLLPLQVTIYPTPCYYKNCAFERILLNNMRHQQIKHKFHDWLSDRWF